MTGFFPSSLGRSLYTVPNASAIRTLAGCGNSSTRNIGYTSSDVPQGNEGVYARLYGNTIVRDLQQWAVATGTGAQFTSDSGTANVDEVYTAFTGTATTGASGGSVSPGGAVNTNSGMYQLGLHASIDYASYFYIQDLTSSADIFSSYVGLFTSMTSINSAPLTWFGFRYGPLGFQSVSSVSGTETAQSTGITLVAGTWYRLRVNYTASLIKFYINDVQVASINSNIPGSTIAVHDLCSIVKAGGTIGTTQRVAKFSRRVLWLN